MSELVLPYAVIAALWLPRLAGRAEAALVAVAGDEAHLVADPGGSTRPLREAMIDAGEPPVEHVGALLPMPGRVEGLPAAVTAEAVEAGQVLLVGSRGRDVAVIPDVTEFGSELERGTLVRWRVTELPATERPLPSLLGTVGGLGEARLELTQALVSAADVIEGIGIASWRDDAGVTLAELMRAELPVELLPPGLEPRRIEVLSRAARLLAVVEAAADDGGGHLGVHDGHVRHRVLADLDAVARRALAAASITRVG